jgi:hypothetical protein
MIELADGTTNSGTIWAAVIASGAALVGAILSAMFAYLVTRRTVRAASKDAELTRSHERTMAAVERQQARMFETYLLVTRYVEDLRRVVGYSVDRDRYQTDPPEPEPDRDEISSDFDARVSLIGTPEVQQSIREFNRKVTSFRSARTIATRLEVTTEGAAGAPAIAAAHRANQAGLEALDAGTLVINQMRTDLTQLGAETEFPPAKR